MEDSRAVVMVGRQETRVPKTSKVRALIPGRGFGEVVVVMVSCVVGK